MYTNNIFNQIMKLFPKNIFDKSVKKYKGDHYRKSFSCYHQTLAMIFAHISGNSSLREIEYAFNTHSNAHYHLGAAKVKRTTLARSNNSTNPQIFMDVCEALMSKAPASIRKETGDILEVIDSSPIQLTGKGFDNWTKDHKNIRLQGIKLHIGYNKDSESITKISFSESNVNDITEAKKWGIKSNRTYIFDKGYCDFNWWWQIINNNSHFVSRFKTNTALITLENFNPVGKNILEDSKVIFKNRSPRGGKKNIYTTPLRRIVVNRPDKKTPLILATDRFDLSAEQIAKLYKERWSIELFFKWIKQRLKVKKFIGRSKNAVLNQILTAIISYLLLLIYKKMSNKKYSMHQLFIEIRSMLFSKEYDFYYKKRRNKSPITALPLEIYYGW